MMNPTVSNFLLASSNVITRQVFHPTEITSDGNEIKKKGFFAEAQHKAKQSPWWLLSKNGKKEKNIYGRETWMYVQTEVKKMKTF